MERRAFVAVILMFLVLVLYQMLARPPERPAPEEERRETPVDAAPRDAVPEEERVYSSTRQMEREVFSPESEAEEKRVHVQTDLVNVVLSTRGPALLAFHLKDFQDAKDQWVNLVPDSASGGMLLGIGGWQTSGGLWPVYETDVEHLVLTEADPEGRLVLRWVGNGRAITETLRFHNSSYLVEIDIAVEDASAGRGDEIRLGWTSSVPLTEPNPEKEEQRYFKALASVDTELLKTEVKHLKKEPTRLRRGAVRWAGIRSKYFVTALVPAEGSASGVETGGRPEEEQLGFELILPARQDGGWDVDVRLYAGPIDYRILKELGFGLEQVVDFGHKIIRPLSKLIYWMLVRMQGWIGNYGVVIILLSALTKLLFYPLTQKSMTSMQRMQELQPKMAKLKEQYKNDPKRMNQEVMKLYKEHGVNPVGGCLPLLLQSPVFFALYAVLRQTLELRQAPFVLWINDLSRPDVLVTLPEPLSGLSVLPILMGVCMVWQQRLSSASGAGDPRQKMIGYMMPVFLTIIFFRMPSGLVLYWLVNTVMSVGQQYIMTRRRLAKALADAAGVEVAEVKSSGEGEATVETADLSKDRDQDPAVPVEKPVKKSRRRRAKGRSGSRGKSKARAKS